MAQTLNNLSLSIGRRYGQAASGTATGGSTLTLIDTARLWQPDNTWVNHYLSFTSGLNNGSERLITASAQSTKTLTLDPALTNAVAASDAYTILPLPSGDITAAIQEAVRAAGQSWMQVVTDDSMSFTSAQVYSLPSNLMVLRAVYAGSGGHWVPVTSFEVTGGFGDYELMLREWPSQLPVVQDSPSVLADMRLVYLAAPTMPVSSSTTLGLGEDYEREAVAYIAEYALHILHEMALARNVTGEAARAHISLSQTHYQKAERIKQARRPQAVQSRVRTPYQPNHI